MTQFKGRSQIVSGGNAIGGTQFPAPLDEPQQPVHPAQPQPQPPGPADAIMRALGHWIDVPETSKTDWNASTDATKTNVAPNTTVDSSGALVHQTKQKTGDAENTTTATLDGDGGKLAVSTKTGDDDHSTETTGTFNAGPGGGGAGISKTTKNGDDETTKSANVSYDPSKHQVTGGGSYGQNGNTLTASVTGGPDGIDSATVGGDVKAGPVTAGASFTWAKDSKKVDLHAGADLGPVNVGLTYKYDHEDAKSTYVDEDKESAIGDVVGGGSYIVTKRSDTQTLGGSIGVAGIGAAGDMSSGSSLQVFQTVPDSWKMTTPDQRAAWQKTAMDNQKQQLDQIHGLADVDLDKLSDGTGIRYTSFNGWNASAGVSYGALSVNGGGGQTTANDVTILKQGDKIEVNMIRDDAVSSHAGMAFAKLGVDLKQGSGDTHQFKFSVTASDKPAMDAMKLFMQTGLLPGADHLADPNAQQAYKSFDSAKKSVDALNGDITTLQQKLAANPSDLATQDALSQKLHDLDAAQMTLETNKNFLNDQWKATYAQQAGGGPMKGITVEQVTDVHDESSGADLTGPAGSTQLGGDDQKWVHQSYLSNKNHVEHQYGFDDKAYFLSTMTSEQTMQSDTNSDNVVLRMSSDNDLVVPENAAIVGTIQHSDLPKYVVDASIQANNALGLSGRTDIALNTQQLTAMTATLNNMNNPDSKAMWAGFATRAAAFAQGDDFTAKTGDADIDARFLEGQKQLRAGWLGDIQSRKPDDPLRTALAKYGTDPDQALKAASAKFATIKTPADFQTLPADEQKLYIAVLQQTSGRDHDLTGQRNSFETMAAVSLIADPAQRAEAMRDMFADANKNAKDDYSDGVYQFVKFTERFQNDPATYALIQQGMSFHWKHDDLDNIATNQSKDDITKQFKDGYDGWGNIFGHWNDDGKMFQMLQAANVQGGPKQVKDMLAASGADPKEMLHRLGNDPQRQHMMYDLLVAAGYDVKDVPLAFQP